MITPHIPRSTILAMATVCILSVMTHASARPTLTTITNVATLGGPISDVYMAHREALGERLGSEIVLKNASYQVCANGIIIERGGVAFELHGPIYQRFLALASTRPRPMGGSDDPINARFLTERVKLVGFPTTNVLPFGLRGYFSYFERAVIYYLREEASDSFDPTTGTFLVSGAIFTHWNARVSGLGAPRSEVRPTVRSELNFQHFDRGVIYQSTRTVAIYADMYSYWSSFANEQDNDPDFRPFTAYDPSSVFWPTTDREGNPTLGFPTADRVTKEDGSMRQEFENGTIIQRPVSLPRGRLRFFAQNMALLPEAPFVDYLGTERSRSIQGLITHLREAEYDVVGLSECFANGERDRIASELRASYPYRLDGPDERDILEQDGGLMMLSRHPFTAHHQTIYRQCSGVDCLANKGALHMRVQVPGFSAGSGYDIFLSHLQNPDEGGTEAARSTVSRQFSHLSSFIRANSSPDRPAILLGDLNTDAWSRVIDRGLHTTVYDDMRRKLNFPRDVWLTGGGIGLGITLDSTRSFEGSRRRLAVSDPARGIRGQRVDYFLSWQGTRFLPRFYRPQVVILQSSVNSAGRGRDISDHYGISTEIASISEFDVEVRRPITRVRIELSGFRCLNETSGTGDDQPYFELRVTPQRGTPPGPYRVARVSGIHDGSSLAYASASMVVGDPGDYLEIAVRGWEYDSGSTDDDLGNQRIRLSRAELLTVRAGRSISRVLPLFTGGGSEYAVTIRVTVD